VLSKEDVSVITTESGDLSQVDDASDVIVDYVPNYYKELWYLYSGALCRGPIVYVTYLHVTEYRRCMRDPSTRYQIAYYVRWNWYLP
jgi:hypothetical protein